MAHTVENKEKIIKRVNRIKGQLNAFSEAIENEQDCYKVMQLLASCRGALNGLMGDLVNDHIRDHIVDSNNKKDSVRAGEELVKIMESFWK